MEKLNLRKPKIFDYSDEVETVNPRISFYCVSEGATEESYLIGVSNNKAELNIKNNVYIHVIKKEKGQETYSHPLQLVKACLTQLGRIDEEGEEIPQELWADKCRWDNYDDEIDEVCVAFDRDYKKLEDSWEEIERLCKKHKIRIVMSNPNFELWLLMHFRDIEQYDFIKLKANKKNLRHQICKEASKDKKYLKILVSKKVEGYKKGKKIHFEKFCPIIDDAVEEAKKYCEDLEEGLFDEIGTSMGKLIEKMRIST